MVESICALESVPPTKWARDKVRSQVIRRYLEIKRPTMGQTAMFADELGLKRTEFRKLVHQEIAKSNGQPVSKGRAKSLDPRVDAEVTRAICKLGSSTPRYQVHAVVCAACRKKDLPEPSFATVWRRLNEAGRKFDGLEEEMVYDEVTLRVAVQSDKSDAMQPTLTAVVHLRTGRILGYHLSATASESCRRAAAIADAIVRLQDTADNKGPLADHASPRALSGAKPRGAVLGPILGLKLGTIPVVRSNHDRTLRQKHTVVDFSDLSALTDSRIARINHQAPALDYDPKHSLLPSLRAAAQLMDGEPFGLVERIDSRVD